MSRNKRTNVYYYRLDPEHGTSEDEKKIFKKQLNKSIFNNKVSFTPITQSDGEVNIHNLKIEHERYVFGTFVYTLTSNIPPSYNMQKNEPSELNIGDYEGLGYDSSFIYDRKTRIIGLENKKPGTTPNSVNKMLTKCFNLPKMVFKDVVLPDEYEEFMKSTDFTRIEFDLAIPENAMGLTKDYGGSAQDILDIMQSFHGMNSRVVISNGLKKSSRLDAKTVKQFVQSLFKVKGSKRVASNIRVTGYEVDSNKLHIFDLVTNRLVTKLSVSTTRTIGNFQIKDKYRQLEGDFLKYREQLERLK